jgi:hypothetical protein
VHFSLLIVCFALYGLSVAGKSSDFNKALEQLARIDEVLSRWEPEWLENAAALRVDQQDSAIRDDISLGIECDYNCGETSAWEPNGPVVSTKGLRLRSTNKWTLLPLPGDLLKLAYPEDTLNPRDKSGPLWSRPGKPSRKDPQFIQPVPTDYSLAFRPFKVAAPQTLEEFESLWNGLGSISATVTFALKQQIGRVAIGVSDESFHTLYVADNPDIDWPGVTLRLEPMTEYMKAWWRDITEHELLPQYQYIGYTPWGEIFVPALVDQFQLNALSAFNDYYNTPWGPGSFAMNFPELSALTIDISDYSFDKLKSILERESIRSQDDIELFGLTIPAVVIAKWGSLIIVIVQLYFILHLRTLQQQAGPARDLTLAPWIGVYPDMLSRITTAVSACLLPPLLLSAITLPDIASNPGLVIIVALSVLLGAWSFLVMKKLWRLLDLEK